MELESLKYFQCTEHTRMHVRTRLRKLDTFLVHTSGSDWKFVHVSDVWKTLQFISIHFFKINKMIV